MTSPGRPRSEETPTVIDANPPETLVRDYAHQVYSRLEQLAAMAAAGGLDEAITLLTDAIEQPAMVLVIEARRRMVDAECADEAVAEEQRAHQG